MRHKTGMRLLTFVVVVLYCTVPPVASQEMSPDQLRRTKVLAESGDPVAQNAMSTAYAVHANGKFYKLDSSGNAKIAADLKSGAIKADKDGDVHASVTGSLNGDIVNVDTVKGGK